MEVLSYSPRLVYFHHVISDSEIDLIKRLAHPKVSHIFQTISFLLFSFYRTGHSPACMYNCYWKTVSVMHALNIIRLYQPCPEPLATYYAVYYPTAMLKYWDILQLDRSGVFASNEDTPPGGVKTHTRTSKRWSNVVIILVPGSSDTLILSN